MITKPTKLKVLLKLCQLKKRTMFLKLSFEFLRLERLVSVRTKC